jgi:hypothetical protein
MAKVLRLDLGDPLASDFDDFCKAMHRKKTELIRELISNHIDDKLKDPEIKKRVAAKARERRKGQN